MGDIFENLVKQINNCRLGHIEEYLPIYLIDEHQDLIDEIEENLNSIGKNTRLLTNIGVVLDAINDIQVPHYLHIEYTDNNVMRPSIRVEGGLEIYINGTEFLLKISNIDIQIDSFDELLKLIKEIKNNALSPQDSNFKD